MSRRSERRRRALQRSQQFANERVRAARERMGLDEDSQPLHTDAIAEAPVTDDVPPEHDPSEIGRAPGELPAASPFESEGPTRFRVICYNEHSLSREEFSDVDLLTRYVDRRGVTWVQMMGLTDPEILHTVGAIFNLPMLAQEDILAIWSRSKFDEYGDMMLAIASAVRLDLKETQPHGQQISFIAGRNFIISFHENTDPVFEAVERRIEESHKRLIRWGPGYLFYALFDTLVDRMLYLTEEVEDAISELEEKILSEGSDFNIDEVYYLKRIVVRLSRTAIPMRETVRMLGRCEHELLATLLDMYFNDLNDHVLRAGDRVEHARMILQNLQDYHHTLQERKTSDIIRVLTVVTSIFIPLTFVVGIYGMNFKNMPEIQTEYGYFVVMGVMILCASGTLVYFHRRKWI
ncbi:MAG: magnesium/cobalt transporter CorA [Puniceicoccales bacterium]|nr:magnesium/cobalt transporter CorA [Puniceicoccales bacterium]